MPLCKSPVRTPVLLGTRRGAWPRFYLGAARGAMRLGTKPECALESVTKVAWYTSPSRIRFDDRSRRIGRVFWVQRRRYSTLDRARRGARPRFYRGATPNLSGRSERGDEFRNKAGMCPGISH